MGYMVTNVTIHTWQQKIILSSSQQVICDNKIILHKKIIVYCCEGNRLKIVVAKCERSLILHNFKKGKN